MSTPTHRREQEMWRVEWVGADSVSNVEDYATILGRIGIEISGDAIAILRRKGFFK